MFLLFTCTIVQFLGHLVVPFFCVLLNIPESKQTLFPQGTRDAETVDLRKKEIKKSKASPFEEDQNRDLKQGDDDDSKINGRGLPNGMDAIAKILSKIFTQEENHISFQGLLLLADMTDLGIFPTFIGFLFPFVPCINLEEDLKFFIRTIS